MNKFNGIIYCATCKVTGKQYIGQTMQKFKARQIRHKYDALIKKVDCHFYNAIRKHGWESFSWELLEQRLSNIKVLNGGESYWISELDTFVNGYNSTTGGDSYVISAQTKLKMSQSHMGKANHIGKKHTDETKRKIGDANLGRTHSEETKKKMGLANAKPVVQIDKVTGYVIREFKSAKEVGDVLEIKVGNIGRCCRGEMGYKTVGGFKWQYAPVPTDVTI